MFLYPLQQQQQNQQQMAARSASEEKLSALKKVYAEIILNTTKESALRILASESKAMRFQQSLQSTKEEAVQTLLRVKGIMDAKVSEAENVSSSQLKRIQELESQLIESENTVKNLKEELEKLNMELQKIKEKPMEKFHTHSGGVSTMCGSPCQENEMIIPDSLPSSSGSDGGYDATSKNQLQPDSILSLKQDCLENSDISSMMINKEPGLFRNGCTQRIRASEQNYSSFGQIYEKSAKLPSVCTNLEQNMCSVKCGSELSCVKTPGESNEVAIKSIKCDNRLPVRFSRRLSSKNCKSKYATRRDCDPTELEPSKFSNQGNLQKVLRPSSPELMNCENEDPAGSTSVDLEKLEENLDCRPDFETADVPASKVISEIYEKNETSPHAIGGRIIKYTFQRKRLRCHASTCTNTFHGKENNEKKEVPDVATFSVEANSPSLVSDSHTTDQIARQLISLSGKRW